MSGKHSNSVNACRMRAPMHVYHTGRKKSGLSEQTGWEIFGAFQDIIKQKIAL